MKQDNTTITHAIARFAFLFFFILLPMGASSQASFTIRWQKCLGGSHDETPGAVFPLDDGFFVFGETYSDDGDVSGFHGKPFYFKTTHGITMNSPDVWALKLDLGGNIIWQKCLGGTDGERFHFGEIASDGTCLAVLETSSKDGNLGIVPEDRKIAFVFLGPNGEIRMCHLFGGTNGETPFGFFQNSSGEFTIIGNTFSNDGDVVNAHGNQDIWIFTFDHAGKILYQSCIGGTRNDFVFRFKKCPLGGAFLLGNTDSFDYDMFQETGWWLYSKLWGTSLERKYLDYYGELPIPEVPWVMRLDQYGKTVWFKVFSRKDEYSFQDIAPTSDGGVVIVGNGRSWELEKVIEPPFLMKLSASGKMEWKKSLGIDESDLIFDVIETLDKDFLVCGKTSGRKGIFPEYHGNDDAMVIKLSSTGEVQWKKCFGGSKSDQASSLYQTEKGRFFILGSSDSNDGDTSGNHGKGDAWLLELDEKGAILRQRLFGGSGFDTLNSLVKSKDGSYLLLGYTRSKDGDVQGLHGSFYDIWIVSVK
ncbi:MAG: hypothetical protein HQM08_29365 [Candidatus Riflebacteria bacterium]|nr:hypothetical protein [Candidatus Riflebacteria bacterium]